MRLGFSPVGFRFGAYVLTAALVGSLSGASGVEAQAEDGPPSDGPAQPPDSPPAPEGEEAEPAEPSPAPSTEDPGSGSVGEQAPAPPAVDNVPAASAEGSSAGTSDDMDTPGEPATVETADDVEASVPPTPPSVLEEELKGGEAPPSADGRRPDGGEEGAQLSTGDRLGSANPTVGGLQWAFPVVFSTTFNIRGVAPNSQLTHNPTWTTSLSLRPRYNITDVWTVSLRQDVSVELTESDFTNTEREIWFEDTILGTNYILPWRPGGVMLNPGISLRLPTSRISSAAERYLGPGLSLNALRSFDILGGLILTGGMSYTHWLSGSNVVTTEDSFPCQLVGNTQSSGCTQLGPAAVGDVVRAGAGVTLIPGSGFALSTGFTAVFLRAQGLAETCVDTLTGEVCLDDGSDTKWRNITQFFLSASYDIEPYLTAAINYGTLAFHPDADAGLENPIVNENTTIGFSLQLLTGGLYVALRDKDKKSASE